MARYADGRLAAFVCVSNGAVYKFGNNPAVGQFADGRLVIFVQGTNSAPYLKWQVAPNGAWGE